MINENLRYLITKQNVQKCHLKVNDNDNWKHADNL